MIRVSLIAIFCAILLSWTKAQNRIDFRRSIVDDMNLLNRIYEKSISGLDIISREDIYIASIDSSEVDGAVTFYKVDVKPAGNYLMNNMRDTVFTYYFVKDRGGKYYELFGFFASKLQFWYYENYRSHRFSYVKGILAKSNFFNSRQIRFVIRSLRQQDIFLDSRSGLPSVVLRSYYSESDCKKACSYIIPIDIKEYNMVM